MLEPEELAVTATAFGGVPEDQVRRDHLISHVLRAIADMKALPHSAVVFFGGTALARTLISDPAAGARLSEDVDLYTADRKTIAPLLDHGIPRLLRREYPGATWDPALSDIRTVDSARLVTAEGLSVKIQLVDIADFAHWPTKSRSVLLRYTDLPDSVTLPVPTPDSFGGMKTAAWHDRHTARDLYDLAGLAEIGALTAEAAALFAKVCGVSVGPHMFRRLPPFDWEAALAHQTGVLPAASECLSRVYAAYSTALEWE